MKPEYKKYLIGGGIVVLIIIAGFLMTRGKGQTGQTNSNLAPTEQAVPTVDSSVQVSLTAASPAKKELSLKISGIPSGTTSVDYELSYQTTAEGLQGIIGTADVTGKSDLDKTLTLGTCSSGTCVYHTVVGKIQLSLKFSGSYGQKLYQKELSI